MRMAYFDCVSGVSGDMTLAALVSAGWPAAALLAVPGRLRLEGVEIAVEPVRRGPFAATRVEVRAPERQPHRHLHHVEALLAAADLPESVRERARAVFLKLAEAEAEVHGSTVARVHFHEVGAVDALVDVVGAVLGLEDLGVGRVFASELPLGAGTVMSEHGRIPVPAPATALLLRGAPVRHGPVEAELVTPTGAALLATLVESWAGPPPYRLERVGTGAGAREFADHPNVLRLILGEPSASSPAGRPVAVLECAIDDESPQFVAELIPRLLAAGALDAMLSPVLMKKGRPGSWLVVITEVTDSERLAQLVLSSTSSLGVRIRVDRRLELPRRIETIAAPWGPVRIKVATLPDGSQRPAAEFEDLRAASERTGRPLGELSEAALAAWRGAAAGLDSAAAAGQPAGSAAPGGPSRGLERRAP